MPCKSFTSFDIPGIYSTHLLTEIFGDQKEFTIGELEFKLRGLRFYRGENTEHTVFYCAHQREVLSESLASYIVDLESRKLTDDEGRKFVEVGRRKKSKVKFGWGN